MEKMSYWQTDCQAVDRQTSSLHDYLLKKKPNEELVANDISFRFGIFCLFWCITLTLTLTVNSILEYNVRQTIKRWMDRPLSAMDRPLGERKDRQETSINRQTDRRMMDRCTDRPSGIGWTDCRQRTGLQVNGQTVRRLRSTDRPLGDGQMDGWWTDRTLFSYFTQFLRFFPVKENPSKNRRKINLG